MSVFLDGGLDRRSHLVLCPMLRRGCVNVGSRGVGRRSFEGLMSGEAKIEAQLLRCQLQRVNTHASRSEERRTTAAWTALVPAGQEHL